MRNCCLCFFSTDSRGLKLWRQMRRPVEEVESTGLMNYESPHQKCYDFLWNIASPYPPNSKQFWPIRNKLDQLNRYWAFGVADHITLLSLFKRDLLIVQTFYALWKTLSGISMFGYIRFVIYVLDKNSYMRESVPSPCLITWHLLPIPISFIQWYSFTILYFENSPYLLLLVSWSHCLLLLNHLVPVFWTITAMAEWIRELL